MGRCQRGSRVSGCLRKQEEPGEGRGERLLSTGALNAGIKIHPIQKAPLPSSRLVSGQDGVTVGEMETAAEETSCFLAPARLKTSNSAT